MMRPKEIFILKGNTAIAEAEAESKKRQKKISRRGLYFKVSYNYNCMISEGEGYMNHFSV